CARALIEAVAAISGPGEPPLQAHVGLALGEVVAGPTGSEAHSAYTVTGDAVNLAARLADRAGAGEILAAEAVRRAARGSFPFREAGALALDGLDRPIRAFYLETGAPPEPAAPSTPFMGRAAELAQLRGLLRCCRRERTGRTVLVRGEAGIGKSRLARELLAGARGFRVHEALLLDFGGGSRARVGTELALGLLGLAPTAPPEERTRAALRAIERAALAAELRLHLLDLLGGALAPELAALRAAMDEPTRDEGRARALAALLRTAAAERPRLLLVEDLHWADPTTLGELALLARTVPECPALLVLTSRPEGDPLERGWRALAADAPVAVIELGPLAAAEAEALASRLLAAEAEAAGRCAARSGGNPLFLEQLARSTLDRREDALPETVQSLVLARVDRLAARDRALLQAASVLGQRFELEALRAVADDPQADRAELVRRDLVRPHGADFLFAHALIRESVYASLLQERRRALHRRAADWYAARDPLLRAEHLVAASDPEAAAALLAAARAEAAGVRLAATRDLLARAEAL
ncbi:MAG: AAA family ATPase, partial [Geminicoccaceae bacterium]|nr:AAA family ATPase [Geminicoccaceae bacterium]